MSHSPKLLRSHLRQEDADRRTFTRRPARLHDLSTHRFPHAASPPGSRATPELMEDPAHGSGVAALTFGDRLARAVAAADWVVERYCSARRRQ